MADTPSKSGKDPRGSSDDATKLHHQLATGKNVETGAGKGAEGGKDRPSTRW
jgi:hypothetical protein